MVMVCIGFSKCKADSLFNQSAGSLCEGKGIREIALCGLIFFRDTPKNIPVPCLREGKFFFLQRVYTSS